MYSLKGFRTAKQHNFINVLIKILKCPLIYWQYEEKRFGTCHSNKGTFNFQRNTSLLAGFLFFQEVNDHQKLKI